MSKKKKKDEMQSPFINMNTENMKRKYYRDEIRAQHSLIYESAGLQSGMEQSGYHNAKYLGYYGKTCNQIKKDRGLENTHTILDHMPSEELGLTLSLNYMTLIDIKENNSAINKKELIERTRKRASTIRDIRKDLGLIDPNDYTVFENINDIDKED